MVVNKQVLQEILKNLKVTFEKAFSNAETNHEKVAMKVPSTKASENYKWLSKFPKMRKWVGAKHVKSLEAYGYTVENEDFEATIEVDRNDIEDGAIGGLPVQAKAAGVSSKELPQEIIEELMSLGFTERCFDGQFYYDTDHEVAGASVSNKITAVLSAATPDAADNSIGVALSSMQSLKDDEGRTLRVKPTVLAVPTALQLVAEFLATSDKLRDGSPNLYKGKFTVEVFPGLKTDTEWHLLDTSKPVMPFLLQVRKEPVFVSMTSMESEAVFSLRQFKFGAEARMAGGYAFWQLAFGSTGTG